MNADGSQQTRLTKDGVVDGHAPSWSPDGKRIVFAAYRDKHFGIYVINTDGSQETRLTNNELINLCPAWSPDGKRIAFVSEGDDNGGIFVMNVDGSQITRLTNTTNVFYPCAPTWSPDSKRIAYTPAPAILPDGTRLQFLSSSDRIHMEIYVMNADGSQPTRLTNNGVEDKFPTWSPDGKRLAFVSKRDGYDDEIYVMNADGSQETRLTRIGGGYPAWSPNGTRIAFVSKREGIGDIYLINPDGNGLQKLTGDLQQPPATPRTPPTLTPTRTPTFPITPSQSAEVKTLIQQANVEMENENYAQVITLTNRAIQLDSNAWDAYTLRGLAKTNDYLINRCASDQCTKFGEDLTMDKRQINPPSASYLMNFGTYLYLEAETSGALYLFILAQELDPKFTEAFTERGIPAYRFLDKAHNHYWDGLTARLTGPDGCGNAVGCMYRGTMYYNEGNYDQAIADFTKSIEFGPEAGGNNYALFYFFRAAAYRQKGLKPQAIADFQMYLKLFTGSDRAFVAPIVEEAIRRLQAQ